jgi:hypothetical protein
MALKLEATLSEKVVRHRIGKPIFVVAVKNRKLHDYLGHKSPSSLNSLLHKA